MQYRRYKYNDRISNSKEMMYVLFQKKNDAMAFLIEYISQFYHIRKIYIYTHIIL